jgi:IPT/TIG domain
VRRSKRRSWISLAVVLALILGLLAGCGGSDSGGSSSDGIGASSGEGGNPSGGGGTTPGGNGNPSGGSGNTPGGGGNPGGSGNTPSGGGNPSGGGGKTPGGGGKPSDDGFDWAPWGPADPGDPPPYDWYGSLERRQCEALNATDDDVWRALGAVCAAAIDGDQSQWTVAKTLAANGGTHDPTSCLERAARALLHRALAWHERNPGRQPTVRFPVTGSTTACPFEIDTVRLWKDGEEVEGTLEGPVTGGTELAIRGSGLSDDPTQVLISGREAKRVITDVGTTVLLVVETPQVDQPLTAEIQVRNRAGEVVAPVTFRYKPTDSSSGTTG